jgi:hypothetical protein
LNTRSRIGPGWPSPICCPSGARQGGSVATPLPIRRRTAIDHPEPRQAGYGLYVKKRVKSSASAIRVLLTRRAMTGSQDHRITGSQDHRITGSQDDRITGSQDDRMTSAQPRLRGAHTGCPDKKSLPSKGRSSQGRDALSFAVPQLTFLTAIRRRSRNYLYGLR